MERVTLLPCIATVQASLVYENWPKIETFFLLTWNIHFYMCFPGIIWWGGILDVLLCLLRDTYFFVLIELVFAFIDYVSCSTCSWVFFFGVSTFITILVFGWCSVLLESVKAEPATERPNINLSYCVYSGKSLLWLLSKVSTHTHFGVLEIVSRYYIEGIFTLFT